MGKWMDKFNIDGKVAIITGGAGLLGFKHAEAILEGNGIPVLLDISLERLEYSKNKLLEEYAERKIEIFVVDITNRNELEKIKNLIMEKYSHIDILINNAANNPKVEDKSKNLGAIQFCNFPVEMWDTDIAVGLTGALLCAQVFGAVMEKQKSGIVVNISSDYGLIAPNQNIYKKDGLKSEEQIIKPVSYSVIKHAIIGFTKYLAVYWAEQGIRVNTLCPASLENGQDLEFINKISKLIPLGRMSNPDEYVCTVLYMISDASTYMTGATIVLDGGRTIW